MLQITKVGKWIIGFLMVLMLVTPAMARNGSICDVTVPFECEISEMDIDVENRTYTVICDAAYLGRAAVIKFHDKVPDGQNLQYPIIINKKIWYQSLKSQIRCY